METSTISWLFRNDPSTTHVVEKGPPPTENVPFTIPMGIIDHVMTYE